MIYMVETKTYVLWDHEPYFSSPAYKDVVVSWVGSLYEARFTLDVDPAQPPVYGCVDRFTVNDVECSISGDRCDVMEIEIPTHTLKNNDWNRFSFYFNPVPIPGIQSGGAYGRLTITADKIIGIFPKIVPEWWWPLAFGLGCIAIVGLAYIVWEVSEKERFYRMLILGAMK